MLDALTREPASAADQIRSVSRLFVPPPSEPESCVKVTESRRPNSDRVWTASPSLVDVNFALESEMSGLRSKFSSDRLAAIFSAEQSKREPPAEQTPPSSNTLAPPHELKTKRSFSERLGGMFKGASPGPSGEPQQEGANPDASRPPLAKKRSIGDSLQQKFAQLGRSKTEPAVASSSTDEPPSLPMRPPRTPLGKEFIKEAFADDNSPSPPSTGESTALPDKDRYPQAAGWAEKIFKDPEIKRFMEQPASACGAAAVRVQQLLDAKNVETKVRALLIWKSALDNVPENHVVVLATLDDGQQFAVDPTAMQFHGARPAFLPVDDWEAMMKRSMEKQAVVYKDYNHVSEAKRIAGPYFDGHVQSFEGGTIMSMPAWYAKVRNNPAMFQDLLDRTKDKADNP